VPRFSVVVPTRDRPDLLDFCLASLAGQSFQDLEVIVSDNPALATAYETYERWTRPGWRYLRRKEPLPMHENFELGCAEARGEYVAVVIDKTILHPSALEVADRELRAAHDPDVLTWRNDSYGPYDERDDLGAGRLVQHAPSLAEPTLYNPRTELARRFANGEPRGRDPVHYVRGKIVFGAFSQRLVAGIREQTGRVFHPLAPDYTSMVPACLLANGAVDVGRPLLLSYSSFTSNGRRQSRDPEHARRWIEEVDPAIIDVLPIPGLYTSAHNVVAYDLVSSAERCPEGSTPALDLANLVRRAREDLQSVEWSDPAEREAQYVILEEAERRCGLKPADTSLRRRGTSRELIAELLVRVPRVERLAYSAAGRIGPSYSSPLEAARAADRYYTARTAS
jgi:hypothetical protein